MGRDACPRETRSDRSPRRRCRLRHRGARRSQDRSRCQGHVLAKEALLVRLGDGLFQGLRRLRGTLPAHVDVGEMRSDRESRRSLIPSISWCGSWCNDVAVLEGARLGLVRIADEVDRLGRCSRWDESPTSPQRGNRPHRAREDPSLFYLVGNRALGSMLKQPS